MRTILITTGAGVVLIGIGITILWLTSRSDTPQAMAVIERYAEYYELAQEERVLLSVPGHQDTESRRALHELLIEILTSDMTDNERLVRVDEALEEIALLRRDIDEATKIREDIVVVIDTFEREQQHLALTELRIGAGELVEAMRERQAIANDITATLYAINGHVHEIVVEIKQADGALTPEHIYDINQTTDMAESRFDRLQRSYRAFSENDGRLQRGMTAFVEDALRQ